MRTIDKIFPDLFAAIGVTLAATWFALVIMGMSSLITNVLFLFSVAFVFELYSGSQEARAAIRNLEKREKEKEVDDLLNKLENHGHEEEVHEYEDELIV